MSGDKVKLFVRGVDVSPGIQVVDSKQLELAEETGFVEASEADLLKAGYVRKDGLEEIMGRVNAIPELHRKFLQIQTEIVNKEWVEKIQELINKKSGDMLTPDEKIVKAIQTKELENLINQISDAKQGNNPSVNPEPFVDSKQRLDNRAGLGSEGEEDQSGAPKKSNTAPSEKLVAKSEDVRRHCKNCGYEDDVIMEEENPFDDEIDEYECPKCGHVEWEEVSGKQENMISSAAMKRESESIAPYKRGSEKSSQTQPAQNEQEVEHEA